MLLYFEDIITPVEAKNTRIMGRTWGLVEVFTVVNQYKTLCRTHKNFTKSDNSTQIA